MSAVNWQAPDYTGVLAERLDRLNRLRADAALLRAAKVHYRANPADFISDWGMTIDPRNAAKRRAVNMPFILWPRQRELVEWMHVRWREGDRGLVEKTRDFGVSWCAVGLSSALWLFEPGFVGGFGSRKEEYVDKKGDGKCIFEKVRHFIRTVPDIFYPKGFSWREHSAHMRLAHPDGLGAIIGEAGDNIGRGGRTSLYLVDEAAFVEHQEAVDAALSANTDCQIDVSTFNGNGNLFYRKRERFRGTDRVFVCDWRDDPRKDEDWYTDFKSKHDAVVVAQEIDRDPNASQEDAFIPAAWVNAAVDAHKALGFDPEGIRVAGFDPADVADAKGLVLRHGSVVIEAMELREGDITHAIPWAAEVADAFRADVLAYDADGMGAPAIKLRLDELTARRFKLHAYHGSAGVSDPDERIDDSGWGSRRQAVEQQELATGEVLRTNRDTFQNYRAQAYTWARNRFHKTFLAVEAARAGKIVRADPGELISLSSAAEKHYDLVAELSRTRRQATGTGKWKAESKEDMRKRGVDSPNLADSLVMAFAIQSIPDESSRSRGRPFVSHQVLDPAVGY